MAQSRPPPSRVHTTPSTTTSSSPPSQAHGEKRHHSRRKSGKSGTEHIATSEKKTSSSRPPTLARKSTPQYVTKVSSSASRQRREEDEDRGRDGGESFPQFCMSCEKQFLPANNTFLYCSESCRIHDHNPPPTPSRISSFPGPAPTSHTPPLTPYGLHFPTHEEGPDIIPRFSPTQSRPRSYFSSDPYPSSYQAPSVLSASVPHPPPSQYRYPSEEKKHTSSHSSSSRKTHGGSSSALESLREIAGALPKVSSSASSSSSRNERKGSKDSHSSSSSHHDSGSGVWGYIPFTSSSSSITPGNSYTPSSYTQVGGYGNVSQSQSYTRDDVQGYSYTQSGGGYGGMDRPLPPRSGPGLGYRPKSIDLVTPYSSGH